MANYGAKILNNSVRALSVQQALIANTSNNIANVNTPGYSRRVVSLQTAEGDRASSSGIQIGNGVDIANVNRVADEYINNLLLTTSGNQASSELQDSFMSRIEQLFSLSGDNPTITDNLNSFFNGLNDLTANPSSIETRKVVLSAAQDLITSIKGTYDTLAALQTEADSRISTEINTVNETLKQIASTNASIVSNEYGGTVDADGRDRRDQLLQDLAKKISFQTANNADGSINIYLNNGFTLVGGAKSYSLSVTKNPSFAPSQPPSLDGGVLSSITFDYSNGAGTSDFDLTQVLKNGTGTVGALLQLRGYNSSSNTNAFQADGTIVEVASRVEAIARDLLTRFNQTYQGDDIAPATPGWQSNAVALDGSSPGAFGFFTFDVNGAAPVAHASSGHPTTVDLAFYSNPAQTNPPIVSYASKLALAFTDPRLIAAAKDTSATTSPPTLIVGNGQNAAELVKLRTTATTSSTPFSVGNFSFVGTYDELYNEAVGHVSGVASSISNKAQLDKNYLITVQKQRDEVSAVSLDEEFSNLIVFQKAYQASAKMMKVADDMLSQILQLL